MITEYVLSHTSIAVVKPEVLELRVYGTQKAWYEPSAIPHDFIGTDE